MIEYYVIVINCNLQFSSRKFSEKKESSQKSFLKSITFKKIKKSTDRADQLLE